MKNFSFVFCLLTSALLLYWTAVFADSTYKGYNMEVLRVAITLNYEYGSAKNEQSLLMVGATIRNRVRAARTKNPATTFSDVVYQNGQYTTYKENGIPRNGPSTANFSGEKLYKLGEGINGSKSWERCLRVAKNVVDNVNNENWHDPTQRAVSYHHLAAMAANQQALKEGKKRPFGAWEDKWHKGEIPTVKDYPHHFLKFGNTDKENLTKGLGSIPHKNYNMDASKGDNSPLASGAKSGNNTSVSTQKSSDSDGSDKAANCGFENMQRIYFLSDDPSVVDLPDEKVEEACWYCKIVIVLTNAYLQGARNALSSSIALGKIILHWGFLIWLAYYLLQQVSSIAPISTGKMLQEILLMGFKVALAWLAINTALDIISTYYLNPIVGLGVDYGNSLFAKLG